MNLYVAILEVKGIITHEEAEAIADNLKNGLQAAHYDEALRIAKTLLTISNKK